eukprot:COSAG01_NODE_10741_length_2091_cov_2.313253_2_plen_204_part_00
MSASLCPPPPPPPIFPPACVLMHHGGPDRTGSSGSSAAAAAPTPRRTACARGASAGPTARCPPPRPPSPRPRSAASTSHERAVSMSEADSPVTRRRRKPGAAGRGGALRARRCSASAAFDVGREAQGGGETCRWDDGCTNDYIRTCAPGTHQAPGVPPWWWWAKPPAMAATKAAALIDPTRGLVQPSVTTQCSQPLSSRSKRS